ncbi:hypothetical protein BBJ28_00012490 [Nothophytophthora sp. Chile5]|nr:hypothetical protein BBJ28_00012490 [Nothophytophthora sp. Chile5]
MKLRILTFNVFFDAVGRSVRMKAIGRMVEHMRPAVIGFQELTREALALLKAQETYFVALFSALPVLSLETHPFANTGMGRELVVMEVEAAPGKTLFVGTSHLESLPQFAAPRVSQLRESLTLLRDRVNNSACKGKKRQLDVSSKMCLGAVFMGDTNLMRSDMKLLDPRLAAFTDVDVEQAKSGRSKCRTCGEAIAKGAIRVGKMAKDRVPGGKILEIRVWFHDTCFLGAATTTDDEKRLVQKKVREFGGEEHSDGDEKDGEDQGMDLVPKARCDATMGLPGGWKDLWLSVPGNTEENGYTFDGTRNTLVTSRAFRSRLDRMYFYRGSGSSSGEASAPTTCKLDSILIVGQEKIAEGLWPSDHYGLLSTFTIDTNDESGVASKDNEQLKSKKARLKSPTSGGGARGSKRAPISID